jgi:tetratricopeptide (TPR) repeat protein
VRLSVVPSISSPFLRVLVFVLVGAIVACGSDEDRVEAALARFENALENRDVSAARVAVGDIAAALPESADSAYKVAHLWIRAGEYSSALWLLEESIERYPEAFDLSITFAEISMAVGDASSAVQAIVRVPEDSSQGATAALLRARAQRDLGDGARSLETLADAEEVFASWHDFRGLRIEYLVEDQQLGEALELIRDARSRDDLPSAKRSWFAESEASLLARDGQTDEALLILGELAEADAENERAWSRRAQLLVEQKRFDESCELLAAALERRPDLGFLYDMLAASEAGRGDLAEAEALYRRRVDVVGDVAGVERLALHLVGEGRAIDAAQVLAASHGKFTAEESIEIDYLEVAILLDAGNTEAARRRFDAYRKRHWSDPRVEYLRARFELADGDASAAAERLNQLLPRFDRSDVQHWYGKALQALGDYDAAENRYGIAILRNPQQAASYKALMALLERRGAWHTLREAAEKLLHVEPDSELAVGALSRALIRLGTPESAEEFLRLHARVYPDLEASAIGLVVAVRAQGRVEEALEILEASRERYGDRLSWRAERTLTLMELGRGEEALDELNRPGPDGSAAALHRLRAVVLFESGRGEAGVAEAERALELDPAEPAPWRWLADHHAQQEDFETAAAAYRRYLAHRPTDAEAHFRLGVALEHSNQAEAAIDAYEQAIEIDGDRIAARNNLALMLDAAGLRAEALVVAQSAFARDSESPMVLDTLGWLYVEAERGRRGVHLLERARAGLPDDPTVAYHLAVGLRKTGRSGESRALLQEIEKQLGPDHALRAPVAAAVAALESPDAS